MEIFGKLSDSFNNLLLKFIIIQKQDMVGRGNEEQMVLDIVTFFPLVLAGKMRGRRP